NSNDPLTPAKTITASGTGGTATITTTDIDFMVVDPATPPTQNISITNTATTKAPMSVSLATFQNNSLGWFKFNQGGCTGTTPCSLAFSITTGTSTVGITCAPPV